MHKQLLAIFLSTFATIAVVFGQTLVSPMKPGPMDTKYVDRKGQLTAENFRDLHKTILPQDSEWRHLRVEWLTDIVAARKKAVAEDKPIIVIFPAGAGYNEPLGTC